MGFTEDPDNNGNTWTNFGDLSLNGSVDGGAEAGSGGTVLSLFSLTRRNRLKKWDPGAINNKSSFAEPKGIVDGASNSFSNGVQNDNGELAAGVGAELQAADFDGSPIKGQASVDLGDEGLGGARASGTIIAAASPPGGVASGSNSGLSTTSMTIEFTPSEIDGVPFEQTATYPRAGTFSTDYGLVFGRISDADGIPIEGSIVSSKGVSSASDDEGIYELYAPTGNSITINALDNTKSQQITPSDRLTQQDWQFGGIEVKITGPNGVPVVNSPVKIDGTTYRTDETGIAREPLLGLGDHTVTIGDNDTQTVSVDFEGEISRVNDSAGARVEVTCVDADSGEPIVDLPCRHTGINRLGYTSSNGRAGMIAPGGEQEIKIGNGDPRYETTMITENVTNGNTKERTVQLTPAVPTTNN